MTPPSKQIEWVRFECGGSLTALTAVSPAAELAHRRLSEYHWHTGEWPTDRGGNVAALCRVRGKQWARVAEELSTQGWRTVRGHLFNSEVHRVRARAVAALRTARATGRKGAERRWAGNTAQGAGASPGGPPIGCPSGPHGEPNRDPNAPLMPINDKSTDKDDKALNDAERLTRIGSARKKGAKGEKQFLEEVAELMTKWRGASAKGELANWGGWWRNRYREDAGKAGRVLAEVGSLVKEGRVEQSPGAAAVDLWKRLP